MEHDDDVPPPRPPLPQVYDNEIPIPRPLPQRPLPALGDDNVASRTVLPRPLPPLGIDDVLASGKNNIVFLESLNYM
jgi:hypothetical protein